MKHIKVAKLKVYQSMDRIRQNSMYIAISECSVNNKYYVYPQCQYHPNVSCGVTSQAASRVMPASLVILFAVDVTKVKCI